ncbi:hypothetical protein [Streptomyces roseicoloratus]|uniref:ABM domain-containing protein n=1 Tax=Streptomyces roseicoloratus TaxID=2508722 RepID=A0ABY9RU58_9ACTN|nr:hypothetical protein [Streptomyces roseicoloratus]WMX45482.1 hypothetical protein RGF97_12350 [Streptomyces roseicoloratus]
MTTVTLMWEARAAEGRGAALLDWARAQPLPAEPLRRETFRAPQDRVLVLTWWETADGLDAELPELPEPDTGLITRPVHRWRFESVG